MLDEFSASYASLPSSISLKDVQARKELVTGKLFFISTVKFARPTDGDFDFHKMNAFIDQYCASRGYQHSNAQWSSSEGITVGIINRQDMNILNLLQIQSLFPFIRQNVTGSHKPEHFILLEKTLPTERYFQVDDDPNAPFNAPALFEIVTSLISPKSSWIFDQKVATTTLEQIEIEERELLALSL